MPRNAARGLAPERQSLYPAGALYSSAQGITLPQSAGDTSANFIVLTSSSPLPTGQTACSHGIQDNVSASIHPGIRNLGCNGSSMSYQLGTMVTPVSGAFTLANGSNVNTSSYNDVGHMYTIEYTGNNQNGLITGAPDSNGVGPHHYAILNAEIRPLAGVSSTNAPLAIGSGGETAESQIPTHIHVAYSYIHGDWSDAPVSGGVASAGPIGANSLANVIAMSGCITCSIAYSYSDKALRPGAEGHTIALKLAKRIKLVHNWFEGQGIGHLCGGWAAAIPINGFVTCQDMEDRGNRYTYPYSWMQAWQAGYAANNLPVGGHSYSRKNAHEYKFSQRVVLDGNIFENVDDSGAQNGTIISFKTAQNSGGAAGDNYWTIQTDTTITNNVLRNSCNGPSLGDRSAGVGNGGGTSLPSQRLRYVNNLLYHVSTGNPGCNANGFSSNPQYGFRQGGAVPGAQWIATASRDTTGTVATLTLNSLGGLSDWAYPAHYPANSMILPTSGNAGGFVYQSGSSAGDDASIEPTWNQTIGGTVTDGTVTWTNLGKTPGVNQSTVNAGDPIQIANCSDTTFNSDPAQMGPLAQAGTVPTALRISYRNSGTANATATGCTVSIGQGWPNQIYMANNSNFIAPVVSPRTGGNDPNSSTLAGANPLLMARNFTFKNSIFAGGGGMSSTFGEGTRTQTKAYDPSTLEFNNLVFVGRDTAVACPDITLERVDWRPVTPSTARLMWQLRQRRSTVQRQFTAPALTQLRKVAWESLA